MSSEHIRRYQFLWFKQNDQHYIMFKINFAGTLFRDFSVPSENNENQYMYTAKNEYNYSI